MLSRLTKLQSFEAFGSEPIGKFSRYFAIIVAGFIAGTVSARVWHPEAGCNDGETRWKNFSIEHGSWNLELPYFRIFTGIDIRITFTPELPSSQIDCFLSFSRNY